VLARLEVGKVLQDTALLLRNSADVRPDHVVDADAPQPVWCEADENQVRQIVWNLATNGLRAMTNGGRLLLSVRSTEESGNHVVVLTVQDQGCGIPAEEVDSIFQPFRSSFERGTGLGLAIVHRLVTDYNGTIEVSSEMGVGTIFTVKLPVHAGVSSTSSADGASARRSAVV
jgi:signal transduction histidine kinase